MRKSDDEKILSYNDVVLRQSDLGILSGPHFLNDRIIEFYFSYLSSCHSQDILLVPPSIAFWLMNCPDATSLKDFIEPLKLHEKKLVIFPVNDNDDVSIAEGGSHWSLLAYERNANVFVHHDSNHGMNKMRGKQLFKAVVGFIGDSTSVSTAKYLECSDSPQQTNGFDCGVYVTAIARVLCCWYDSSEHKDKDDMWFSSVKERITPSAVAETRKEILQLIKDLMARK
ncbi:NEDD8-specific protease 1-like [Pistacia vera]|uniref:NEDD8-specific protease 1-like n=1 Tax=Pistacia vera TaxID=55513 RepID=UPI001263E108|nr:NEDD8-specific protease 1-like [Pistacia vera]XP_031252139.1 NEDD8-specific protease 1-like [Pistacia vera]